MELAWFGFDMSLLFLVIACAFDCLLMFAIVHVSFCCWICISHQCSLRGFIVFAVSRLVVCLLLLVFYFVNSDLWHLTRDLCCSMYHVCCLCFYFGGGSLTFACRARPLVMHVCLRSEASFFLPVALQIRLESCCLSLRRKRGRKSSRQLEGSQRRLRRLGHRKYV